MNTRRVVGVLAVIAALASSMANADFQEALRQYNAGAYDAAHGQFLALAELGDGASQFNLGAMALRGQGGPKDYATGVGWLLAAAENGYSKLAPEKLGAMEAKLTEEQRRVAQGIVSHYGHAALLTTVLPPPDFEAACPDVVSAKLLQDGPLVYPFYAQHESQDGIVITELTIGVDGLARDPEVLMAAPKDEFPAAAIDALLQGRFEPATQKGVPVESKLQTKTVFMMNGQGFLWRAGALKQLRTAADAGIPAGQYIVGLAATLDASVGIPTEDARKLLVSAAQGGNAEAQYWVGRRLEHLTLCHGDETKLPWLRQSAASGDGSAQLAVAMTLLSTAPTPEQLTQIRSLLGRAAESDSFYVRKHVTALMAASPLEGLRNPATALVVGKKLLKGDIQSDPQMFEALAAAYAVTGDFSGAVATQATGIKKAKKLYWNTSLMEERLATYRASKPWVGDLFLLPPATTVPPPLPSDGKICHEDVGNCKHRRADEPIAPVGSRIPR